MDLQIGDRLLVTDPGPGCQRRLCRVVDARGPGRSGPYVVLRYDTGREELLDPDSELRVAIVPEQELVQASSCGPRRRHRPLPRLRNRVPADA